MSTTSNRISFQYVKVGTSTYSGNADTVNVAFNKINSNFTAIANSLSNILVPIANQYTTGTVRIGQGINVTPDGVISVGQTVHVGAPGYLTGEIGDSVGTLETDNNVLYVSTGSYSPSFAFNPIFTPPSGGTQQGTGTNTATITTISTTSLATTSSYVYGAAGAAVAQGYTSGEWVVYDTNYNAYPVTNLVVQRGTTPVVILTLNTTTAVSSSSVFYVATNDIWHRIPYLNHQGFLPVNVIPYQVGNITYSYSTVSQAITVIGTTQGDLTLQPTGPNTVVNSNLIINGALNLGAPLTVSTTTAAADYTLNPVGNILLERPTIASSATTMYGQLIATATLTHQIGGISLGPMVGASGELITTNVNQQDLYLLPYGNLNIGDSGKAVTTNIYGNTNITGNGLITGDFIVDNNLQAPVFRIPTTDNQFHVLQNTGTHDLQVVSVGNTYFNIGGSYLESNARILAPSFTGPADTPVSMPLGASINNGVTFDSALTIHSSNITASNGNTLTVTGGAGSTDSIVVQTNNTFGTITLTASNASAVFGTGIQLNGNSNSTQLDVTDSVYVKSGSSTWKFDQYGRIVFPDSTVQITAFTANPTLQGLTVTNVALVHQLSVQTTATVNGQLLVNNTATISQDLNVLGSAIISGNLTVLGSNTIVNSTSTAVADAVIDIGGGPNGTALTANDGLDKGIVLHYFNTQNTRMFLGRDTATGRLILRDNIDPGTGPAVNGDFSSGGVWGGASFGSLKLLGGSNATGYNNGTGDLQITGGAAIQGDLWVGGSLNLQGGDITIGSATFDNGLTVAGSQNPGTKFFVVNTGGATPSNTFVVDSANGNTTISGTLQVNGSGTITGLASLQNALNLAGDFNINLGKFTVASVTGNTAVAGTMNVTGAVTLNNILNVGGTFAINSNKFLVTGSSGNTAIAGTLNVANDLAINVNKFNVQASTGNTAVAGTLNVTGGVGLLSTLNVTGAVTMSSSLGLTGNFSVGSNVFTVNAANGNTVVQGTLNVTGGTVFSSGISVAGATYLNSTANVAGDFTVNTNKFLVASATGNFTAVGDGNVGGSLTVANTATINGTLGVVGATSLNSTLAVGSDFSIGGNLFTVGGNSGNTAIAGSLNVSGASSLTSSLYVAGIVTMASGQNVQGQVTYTNPTNSLNTTSGALVVTGGVGVGQNLNIGGTLYAANAVTFGAGLQLTGSLQLNGNKFTVNASNGNTVVAGTLAVASDFAINTNQFTVQASTGNTVVGGTLQINNNTTVAGTQIITGPSSQAYSLRIKGSTTGDQFAIGTNGTAGFGIANDILNAAGTSYSSYNLTANTISFNINGNPELVIDSFGVVKMKSATASASTTTGGLVVTGGVGIGGSTYIGGDAVVTGNVTAVQGNFSGNVTDNSQRVLVNLVPSGSSGINISNLTKTGSTVTFTINNLGVNTLAGTTNNITVSQSTGSVTINLGTTGTQGTYAYPDSIRTDQFGRVLSVTANTATGTGPHVLATSPTINTPTVVGQFTATAYTGYLYGNGSGAVTAIPTLPGAVVTGTVPAAYTATVLTATQNFSLSGDVSSPTVGFNGTAGVVLNSTLATVTQANSGNFNKFTLDTKGRVVGNTPVTAVDIATTLGSTAVTNASNVLVSPANNNNPYYLPFVLGNSSYQAEYVYGGYTFNPGSGVLTTPQVAITGTTVTAGTSSGALTVAGGVGVGGSLYVGGTAYILGDLIVDGNQTFVNSTNIQTGDKAIYLSTASIGPAIAVNAGIFVGPTSGPFASLSFDGSSSWKSAASIIPSAVAAYGLGTSYYQWTTLYANAVYDNNNRVLTNITQGTGTVVVATDATTKAIYLSPATTSVMGGVRIGSGLSVAADGLLTTNAATMSTATSTALGVIKVGNYINLSSDATISLPQAIYTTSTVTFNTLTATSNIVTGIVTANTQVDVAGQLAIAGASITVNNGNNLIINGGGSLGDGVYINTTNATGNIALTNALGAGLSISPTSTVLSGASGGSVLSLLDTNVTLQAVGQIVPWTFTPTSLSFPDGSTQIGAAISATVTATNIALGYVKIGNNIYGAGDGTISVHTATNSAAGAVKIGSGIYVAADGTISIPAGGGGVASITAGTGTHITASTGTPVLYIGQAVETTSAVTFGSVTSTGSVTDNGNRVITSVTPTAGAGINISSLTSTGPSASFTINNLGVNSLAGSSNIIASQSTGAVTVSFNTLSNLTVGNVTSTGTVSASVVNDNGNRVVTQVDPVAGTAINISGLTANGPTVGFTINNLGVTSLTGAATIKVSASTGSVTLTDLGVTAIQPGTGITVNANTGSVTVTNAGVLTFNGSSGNVFGVGSATAGTGISVSASTGSVTITNTGVTAFNGATGSILGVNSVNAGTNVAVSATTGSVTVSVPNIGVTAVNGSTGSVLVVSSVTAGTGINLSASTGSVTISNIGVQSITGTANQVIASSATGTVTLSLPQSIATNSSPTFQGLTTTGTVSMTGGQITIGGGTAGTIDNMAIGGTTATTARVTGFTVGYASVTTTPFTANAATNIIGVNHSSATAVTLPANTAGRMITIKDESGAAATNPITITPASGTIDGQANLVLNINYGAYVLYCNGSNWFII